MAPDAIYDVFLSHATQDKPQVEELARRLKAEGLKPFLDKWHLVPGEPWQEAIEIAMARSLTCVVFVGPGPLGPWQNEEMRNALDMRVHDNSRRVIPVLLPGSSLSVLPPFLARLTWVDFRNGFNNPEAFQRLVRGIQGKEPEDGQAGYSAGRAPWQRPKGKTPKAKDLRQLWFEWPESLYGRFNFQRDEHIDALTEWLLGTGMPAVVVLGGQPGIGRSFLCDAAARRAREQGHKAAVWHLDLDGFEPNVQNPLTHYLRHLVAEEERHPDAARGTAKGTNKSAVKILSDLDLLGPATEVAASLLSLLWQFVTPLKRFAALLDQPPRGTGLSPRDDPETLRRFFSELTHADFKLLVHVTDGPQLTSNLRRLLIREAELAPEHMLLVISCPQAQTTERSAPEVRSRPERFDLRPLDAAELRILLDRRFEPNEFPDDFVALLMRRCHGWPVAIANLLADLMDAELVVSEGKIWRLPPAGLENPQLVYAFSHGLFEEVDKPLATLAEEEPELARRLRDILSLAALCGRYIPIAALLEHLQLDNPTAEAAVDWVDDVLVGKLGWLTDLGFHIPGFYGCSVYAFTHLLLPLVILNQEAEITRETKAAHLLQFLEQRVQITKRGWARCFLSLAEHLDDEDVEPYRRSLEWWIGTEAADILQAEIRTAIARKEVEPEAVWRSAKDSKAMTAYQRLAVLDAYAQATVEQGGAAIPVLPFARLVDFHLLRSELLIDVGRYAEALDDALNALKLASRDSPARAQALSLSGSARLRMGDTSAAQPDLETALALCRLNWGEEHRNTLAVRNMLVATLYFIGDLTGARELNEQNLDIHERVLGREHHETLAVRNNLAENLRVLGEDLARARKLHQENLAIHERVLGLEHPDTLGSRHNLALTLFTIGDFAGAKKLYEQTLEIRERLLGPEHPHTTISAWSLLLTVRRLHDADAEAPLLGKLRWLLNRDENSIQSADQRDIRQWLLDLLNPS